MGIYDALTLALVATGSNWMSEIRSKHIWNDKTATDTTARIDKINIDAHDLSWFNDLPIYHVFSYGFMASDAFVGYGSLDSLDSWGPWSLPCHLGSTGSPGHAVAISIATSLITQASKQREHRDFVQASRKYIKKNKPQKRSRTYGSRCVCCNFEQDVIPCHMFLCLAALRSFVLRMPVR